MATIGYTAILLSMMLALYACVSATLGRRKGSASLLLSARNAVLAVAVLLSLAVAIEVYLLVSNDFRTLYVAQVSSRSLPLIFKVTALWGSQSGSLLFWSWLMSLFGAGAVMQQWRRLHRLIPHVIAVTQGTLLFFLTLISGLWAWLEQPLVWLGQSQAAVLFADMARINPFFQLNTVPVDGSGLNPVLRHWGMILHPPMLYLGFVGFVIPFAFATGALVTGETGSDWLRATRRWTLTAWLFLSVGLILGMWWAYGVLGWGGYWGWDPVENSALMPWLTGTAFLHSAVMQERRGMFKVWNMILIILTYGLVIFGTFLTRSGVVASVHTFAQSGLGPLFLLFVGGTMIYAVVLLFSRLDVLSSQNRLDSVFSREALFLLNNILFLAVAFVTFWGTIFPVFSELLAGQKAIVGPPFFNRVNGPLLALLVIVMGVAPLIPWRKVSRDRLGRLLLWPLVAGGVATIGLFAAGMRDLAVLPGTEIRLVPLSLFYGIIVFAGTATLQEIVRGVRARRSATNPNVFQALGGLFSHNQRRYGGYLVHLGVILMALGILGTSFMTTESQQNLAEGETMTIRSALGPTYELRYLGLGLLDSPADVQRVAAAVAVSRNGRPVGGLQPRRDFFIEQEQPMTVPAIRHTAGDDLYLVLAGWENSGQTATFKAYVEPLINWLWLGSVVFILGTLVAMWPQPVQPRVPEIKNLPAGVSSLSASS